MLVDEYGRPMFRLAYRMTGNEQDAEDVVQETFVRAYRRLDQFESRAHFASWLHRIAANYSIDLIRRKKRWRSRALDETQEHATLKSDKPGPDQQAFGSEVGERIETALAELSPKERVAFPLRHYEGLSIEEIGRITGTRTNTTKNRIFRTVQKMRVALEPLVRSQG